MSGMIVDSHPSASRGRRGRQRHRRPCRILTLAAGNGGFTLIEVVVSVLILSILVLLWGEGHRMIRSAERTCMNETRPLEEMSHITRLARLLRGAYTPSFPSDTPVLSGDATHLDIDRIYIYPAPIDPDNTAADTCRLSIRPHPAGGIRLELTSILPGSSMSVSHHFFPSAGTITLSYLETNGTWQNSWPNEDTTGLPSAVKFKLPHTEIIIPLPCAGKSDGAKQ